MSDRPALLLDLDDTLVVEEPAAVAAFEATARWAATQRELDADVLAPAARRRARELWCATPAHAWCLRVGISSWEGLWCRFEGDEPDVCWLRAWSPEYRREAWRLALAEQGVEDALAEELAERFPCERRARHEAFPDAADALSALAEDYALALVTNGAACLQREKLTASGLADHFTAVIVSADVGAGKPDAAIFRHALAQLGCGGERAVMVGDSLGKDIGGALAAGLRAVWLNRSGRRHDPETPRGVPQIATLAELPAALAVLQAA